MPALGWTAVRPVEDMGELSNPVRVEADGRTMTNGLLSVAVSGDGTLRLAGADGVRVEGIGRIVDGGDYGDSYNYAPPAADSPVDVPATVEVHAELAGPVRGRLRVTRTYAWPVGLLADGSARTVEAEPTEVVMNVELRADEPFARIALGFLNHSSDHRVRFHAPLPRVAASSHAEGQFAVVERGMAPEGGYREEPLATYPAHGWIDAGGLAVLLEHLSEYELTNGGRELAITVLRSTGLISRNDNPYRQDPAGPEITIPGAQMLGRRQFGFALYPHAGGWADGSVVDAAERHRHGLLTWPGSAAPDAAWPPEHAGADALRIDASDVVLTSLRRRDAGWLEARIVNLAPEARGAALRGGLEEAREVDLRGTPGDPLALDDDGVLSLALGPAEIRTVGLKRRETASGRADVLDAIGPRQSA
jgi:alpha-mannosidase